MAAETQQHQTKLPELSPSIAGSERVVSHQLLHHLANYTDAYHFMDSGHEQPGKLPGLENMIAATGLAVVTDPHNSGGSDVALMTPHGDRNPPGRFRGASEQLAGVLNLPAANDQNQALNTVASYLWQDELTPRYTYDNRNRRIPFSNLVGGLLVMQAEDVPGYSTGIFYEQTFLHRIKAGMEHIQQMRSDMFWGRLQKNPEREAMASTLLSEQKKQTPTATAHLIAQKAILAALTSIEVPEPSLIA